MERLPVRADAPAPEALARAVRTLDAGGIVAFPTETVYGLCVDASNAAAVARLYAAKGRDPGRACAFLLPHREAAARHVDELPPLAARLAEAFWPGPVTLVVPGRAGEDIGLRLPAHALARALARAAARPLLQTSANRSGEEPAADAQGVAASLGPAVDLLLDGGPAPGGLPSTVVRCDARRLAVLRAGAVGEAEILERASRLRLAACTGNLCRSPAAEAMLRAMVADRLGCAPTELAHHGFRFGSFGVIAIEGLPANDAAAAAARERGFDLARHRSRPFSIRLVESAHVVYWLDRSHRDFLVPYFAERPSDLQPLDPKGKEIADPMGRSLRFHRRIAARVEAACRARAEELVPLPAEGEGGGAGGPPR